MSNIEDLLGKNQHSKPRRRLSADFTRQTMRHIARQPRQSLFARAAAVIRSFSFMRLISKPTGIVAGAAILTLTAGTTFAAIQWLQPNTKVTGNITVLENGNKRFWLHSETCQGQDMPFPVKSYYEIKANSNVTPDNVKDYVNSACEDDFLAELFPKVTKSYQTKQFKPGSKQYFFPYVKLKSIGTDYLVVDGSLNGKKYADVQLPLAANVQFYEKGQLIQAKDLKPGKWLTLVTATTDLDQPYATEQLRPEELAKLSDNGFPKGAIVEGAIQRQFDVEHILEGSASMGAEWTRLVEDKNSPDGWKHLIPLK